MKETKFISTENTFHSPKCNTCVHHVHGTRCDAFDVIPSEILTGGNDHSKPLKDQDNEIVYEKED